MTHNHPHRVGATLAVALAVGAGIVSAQGMGSMSDKAGPGSQMMHQQMMSGMQKMQGMQPSGDVDKDFAMMMREHHIQAVEMAKVQIVEGKSAEL